MPKEEKDDDKVTISRSELDALRSKGMSKEEKHLREIIRDELKSALGDVFKLGDDDDVDEEPEGGGGLLKAVGDFLGKGGE